MKFPDDWLYRPSHEKPSWVLPAIVLAFLAAVAVVGLVFGTNPDFHW